MNFRIVFVQFVQRKDIMKESESQKRATRNYIQGQWRPSMYIDKTLQPDIEKHFKSKGYSSFNEYVYALVLDDMKKDSVSVEDMPGSGR